MKLIKTGAMFGLDARIALAIFGALSVISGAALYSAIKSAKMEQWRQHFVEMSKASEAYYLDNGKEIPQVNADYTHLSDLVENRESLSTWKGPYIDGVKSSFGTHAMHNSMTDSIHTGTHLRLFLRTSNTWTEMNDATDNQCTVNNSNCAEWLDMYAHEAAATPIVLQLFNDLDDFVDGGDGALAGNIRYNSHGPGALMYKVRVRKRI